MRTRKIEAIALLMTLILVISGCSSDVSEVDTDEIRLTSIETGTPQIMEIYDVSRMVGKFEVAKRIEVMTGGNGDIKDIYVKTGDKVKQGQKLFRLDNDNERTSYSITESQLRTVKDNLFTQLNDATRNYENKKELYLGGSISQNELDIAATQVTILKNQYSDALTTYNNQVKSLNKLVADRTVTTPISGTVGKINIDKSESVGNIPAIEIINNDNMIVKAKVTSEILDRIKIGMSANIFIDGDKDKVLEGEIIEYNEIADPSSGLYDMVLSTSDESKINEYDITLRSGMFAQIEIRYNLREAILVPNISVLRQGEEKFVYIVEGDKVKKVTVITGGLNNDLIEITDGIGNNEKIVISGQNYISDGDSVNVVNNQ